MGASISYTQERFQLQLRSQLYKRAELIEGVYSAVNYIQKAARMLPKGDRVLPTAPTERLGDLYPAVAASRCLVEEEGIWGFCRCCASRCRVEEEGIWGLHIHEQEFGSVRMKVVPAWNTI